MLQPTFPSKGVHHFIFYRRIEKISNKYKRRKGIISLETRAEEDSNPDRWGAQGIQIR
jgi:hypothetical protein